MADEFPTCDLQLSSFLVALGHQPVRIDGPADRRVIVFADVPADDVAAYYRGNRPVSPQPLFHAYRRLKQQLFRPA